MYTTPDDNLFYFIAAPSLIMAIIFFVFGIFGLVRLKMVCNAKNRNKISLLFYSFIVLETFLRTATYLYVAIESYLLSMSPTKQNDPMSDKVFLAFQYLPDLFVWIIFTLLLWQLLVLFYVAHINNTATSILSIKKNPISQQKLFTIFVTVWLMYLIIQLIFIIMFQTNVISLNLYSEQNSLFNILLPFILFVIEVYLHVVFSGTPYISLLASHKKTIINKVVFFWAIGRILHAVWTVFNAFYEPNIFKKIMTEQELDDETYMEMLLLLGFEIADKIIDEILPFLFVFDLEFVKIFYQEQKFKSLDSLTFDESAKNAYSLIVSNSNQSLIKMPLDFSNIHIIEEEDNQQKLIKKNGFGELKFVLISSDYSKKFVARKLRMKGFTNYLAEEFFQDLGKYYELQNNELLRLNKIMNYSIQESNNEKFLYLISEYYENGSLSNLLKTPNNLNFELKVRWALEICSIFQIFHSCEPPLIHGHLNSNNIVFDEEFKPIISDFGFFAFKKYYILMHSYQQKSIYSAPETLLSPKYQREKSMDVYSFALILYELFVEKINNEIMPLKKLINLVCEEKARPKIPQDFDPKLANLIRCCWQEDKEKRPNFNQIKDNLKKILKV